MRPDQTVPPRDRSDGEQQDLATRQRANQRMESLGTMARGMAHEINNPLNVIINCADIIGDGLAPDADERVDLQDLKDAAERIRKVVHAMLRFSEPDSVQLTPTRPETPVEAVADLLRAELALQGIELVLDLPPGLPQIRVRRRQIEQILINLIQNAAEAMPETGARRIVISGLDIGREGQRWVRLSVRDTGVGIPAQDQERVFDPFFTSRPRHIHAGLGLTVALGHVRGHQGELTIESVEGAGTAAHIDLPAWERVKKP